MAEATSTAIEGTSETLSPFTQATKRPFTVRSNSHNRESSKQEVRYFGENLETELKQIFGNTRERTGSIGLLEIVHALL